MPDWKRLIVGDAFQLPSRDFNYYRDVFLAPPFIFFTIAGVAGLFGAGHDYRVAVKFMLLSIMTILLARERLILISAALGFCAVQSGISFVVKHDWKGLAISIPTGAVCVLLLWSLKDYKPSYRVPDGTRIADILIGLTSLGLTIIVFRWILR